MGELISVTADTTISVSATEDTTIATTVSVSEATEATTVETTSAVSAETENTSVTETTIPPVEIKPIRAILYYGFHAYMSSSGLNGYRFYYNTPEKTVYGETKMTPLDHNDPLNTPGIVNQTVKEADAAAFSALCDELYTLRFDLLPENVPQNEQYAVMDGWRRYIVIYYEDGSVFTSQGYAADSYHAGYKAVLDCLFSYNM